MIDNGSVRSVVLDQHISKYGSGALRGVDQNKSPEELFNLSVPFAIKEARRYASYPVELDDLISASLEGLWVAAQRFDPNNGAGFLTYARHWCRAYTRAHVAEFATPFRIPLQAWTMHSKDARKDADPVNDVAAAVGAAVKGPVSLDAKVLGTESVLVGDSLRCERPSPAEDMLRVGAREAVQAALASMPERHRIVLTMAFGLDGKEPRNLDAIGLELGGLSRERARQLREQALHYLWMNDGGEFNELRAYAEDMGIATDGPRRKGVGEFSWRFTPRLSEAKRMQVRWDDRRGHPKCPHCGSPEVNACGYTKNPVVKYRRYTCKCCCRSGSGLVEKSS